jgi:hypothetical protein
VEYQARQNILHKTVSKKEKEKNIETNGLVLPPLFIGLKEVISLSSNISRISKLFFPI